MGYETKMYVVKPYGFADDVPHGQVICSIDLCKCDEDGAVGRLVSDSHSFKDKNPTFALYNDFHPDGQLGAIEKLQKLHDELKDNGHKELIQEVIDYVEDPGHCTKDNYDDFFGVISIDDMIEALEKDIASEKVPYRRFVIALDMLQSVKKNFQEKVKILTYGH